MVLTALFILATGVGALAALLIAIFPWLQYDFQYISRFIPAVLVAVKQSKAHLTISDLFEKGVKENPKKTFLIFQDNVYSYEYMDKKANQVARVALSLGLKRGDTVALMIYNEPAFIWTYLGLNKIGVVMAFLNFNLRSKSLLHCFRVSEAKILIVGQGDKLTAAIQEIYPDLQQQGVCVCALGSMNVPPEFTLFDRLSEDVSDAAVGREHREGIRTKDPAVYIYTSGTTGLPKAAVVTHKKMISATVLAKIAGMTKDDIFYTALPLYHSAASLICLGAVIQFGTTLVLRDKFSATYFWDDCRRHNVTVIQYIGELCRYLCAKPKSPSDKDHKVRLAVGNGLRPDIWKEFKERFNVKHVAEFYAATEGNIGFMNVLNKFGSVGRVSPLLRLLTPGYFIKYDFDTAQPVRDDKGFCIQMPQGPEPGLFVSPIKRNMEFDGYKGNKDLTEKKILRNVFKTGDAYYNSGDSFVQDKDYFLYFVDRIGDTFRWKGENVSTIEVANVVAETPWLHDANVYGVSVPGQDGRAGMAAVTLNRDETLTSERLKELYHHVHRVLPAYAVPKFLRVQKEMDLTSTFKQKKFDLVNESFNPSAVKNDQLFLADMMQETYVPLDQALYEKIQEGQIRL